MIIYRFWPGVVVLFLAIGGLSCQSLTPNTDSVSASSSPRLTLDLDSGWRFIRQDVPDAQDPAFDDSSWQSITLPHTWNNLDGEDGGDNYYRGIGWYRLHLDFHDQPLTGHCLFLKFDGSSIVTDVFVNGKSAGPTHEGMFGAFCYDITSLANPAGDNVIAVRVNNAPNKDVPPLSADFTFFGGMYRRVHLLALNPVSISPLDDASSGVYLRQTSVSPERAQVEITTKLRNANSIDKTAAVTCQILDEGGNCVGSISNQTSLSAGADADSVQTMTIDHPHLWNGRKDPYLYQVQVSVAADGAVTDALRQPLGLRFFSIDVDHGFSLNGQPYPLHGVNRHQDRIDKGWAIGPAEHAQDFDLIMEMGCTAIRLAHYEHAQEFYDLCDRGGLVVWAEVCLVNRVTNDAEFDANTKQELRELIKQNYNHPSICFWSMFNELGNYDRKKATAQELADQDQHQIELVNQLNQLAKHLDPSRLTTAATLRAPSDPLNQITDVVAFNDYDGWYRGTPSTWPATLDKIRAALPDRCVAISEYGAGASIFEHQMNPPQPKTAGTWHPEEWQCIVHESAYGAMKRRPWLWGTFLWCMFDFASDSRHEGDHLGINDKGLVTYDRKTRKDAFYFYKANWTDVPFVHINDQRFTPRNIATGPVKVYSNCESVELMLNGQSMGSVAAKDHVFVWRAVTLERGTNTLEAVGVRNGNRYSESCDIVYDPGALTFRPAQN